MRSLRKLAAPVALLAALTLAGCGSSGKDGANAEPKETPTTAEAVEDVDIEVAWADPNTDPADLNGGVIPALAARDGGSIEQLAKVILEAGEVDGIAEGFSENFIIPEGLQIQVVSGEEGPNYNPGTKTLTLSYGFAALTGEIIAQSQPEISEEELGKQWAAVNDFILIHELAHAFVDVLDITVTGREEDAADGMATYFFTDSVPGGAEYAFAAANFFAALQQVQGDPDLAQYAGEHSLSIQRAGDIACKVAGQSEENMNIVAQIGGHLITADRLARCPSEYQQMSEAWSKILGEHLADSGDDEASDDETDAE